MKRDARQRRCKGGHNGRPAAYGPKAATSFRRNLLPAAVGLLVMLAVLAGLNSQWIYAQLKYRFDHPAARPAAPAAVAITTPTPVVDANKDPHPERGARLEIPSIGVNAPVGLNQGTAEWQIQLGLRKGTVHFDGSANPGHPGNVVVFGHSSGALWAPGDYKFVFTLLDKLQPGDPVYLYYQGERYTYIMRGRQIVAPTDTAVLAAGAGYHLSLITCTPVGTSKNRLVVQAEQVAPAPAAAAAKPAAAAGSLKSLPGSAR